MTTSVRLGALLASGALVVVATAGAGQPVLAATAPPGTLPATPVVAPVAARLTLTSLRAAAAALDAVGRRDAPAVYAGVALDVDRGRTDLYLTDPGAAPALVAAASRTDPTFAPDQLTVHRAAYPLVTLEAASKQLMTTREPFAVYAAYPAPDASGVEAEVSPRTAAARSAEPVLASVPVPVELVPGSPREPRAATRWDAVKWHDSAPFIGGDVLTSNGHRYCTAGLPAVRTSDRHPVMVTAGHCFAKGQRVSTGAGATWAFGNGRTGSHVGTVRARSTPWDAEVLDGAANDADESDTSGWKPLTSVAYSYRGDRVCQAGARSAADGHPTPCGIKVTIPDLYFREGGHTVRGVEGVDVHGWGSVNGDSGGTVFAVEPHGARQLRGMVSSGGSDGTRDQRRVDWTEAVDVFRTFHLTLNPRT